MICNYCQSQIDENTKFCPVCGAPVPPPAEKAPDYFSQNQTPVNNAPDPYAGEYGVPMINPLLAKTDMLVKDNLFLAVCILQSVNSALPLFGDFKSFNVLSILITIFLWIIYAESKKGLPNPQRIRIISGVLCAYKVILYVLAGLLGLMGILCFFSTSPFIKYFTDAFSGNFEAKSALDAVFSLGGWLVGTVFIVVGIVIALLNYFSYGKMHKFVKSCYENILGNVNALENRNITCVWLIVFAVIMGIAALGALSDSPVTTVVYGAQTATCIISYMLLKKYYPEYN